MLAPFGIGSAQSSPPGKGAPTVAPAASSDPRVAWGTIAGAGDLPANASMQALTLLVEYKPRPWLAFSANPTFVRATARSTTGASVSSSGLTDLPLGATATHEFSNAPWSPNVGVGAELTLPTGDAGTGLGSGQTGFAGDLGLGVSPIDNVSLDLNLWHPFAGGGVNSVLDASAATSLGVEAGFEWSDRLTTSLGYNFDVGRADSGATLPQSIAAGFVLRFAKPIALTVDGAHGVAGNAPRWLVSVGIGTAFTGINPVGSNSLLGQLRHAFGRSVNRGHGKSKVGGKCQKTVC